MSKSKIAVASDGAAIGGTHILIDGAAVKGVRRADFIVDATEGMSIVKLELLGVPLQIDSVGARFYVAHPETGETKPVAKIFWQDGDEMTFK